MVVRHLSRTAVQLSSSVFYVNLDADEVKSPILDGTYTATITGTLVCVFLCVCESMLCVAVGILAYLAVERGMRAHCVIEMSCVQERSLTEREPLAMPQ